ncbi:hypothetical protein HJG60_012130 [Phyllostomus discolor]|uniref:Uncharacterized protein n=1 Tax=Phyllostomus discolor TaxID=89673 RepID=A0A833ZEV9_9CHIR|nr:hypothetical protein HJG60_012130 [Phyllostomus discolor]
MGWSLTPLWWMTIQEGCLRSEEPQTPPPPGQGSSARKKSPHNFWLQKPAGIELVEEAAGPHRCLVKNPHMLRLTLSELQHWGSSLKGTSGVQGENEVSGIKVTRGSCPFFKPSPHRASKCVPYLRLH